MRPRNGPGEAPAAAAPALAAPGWKELAAILAVAAIVILFRLSVAPVYWWDEARVAINAFEMMHGGNPLVVTYNGQPDLWNVKPPLEIWLAASSMRLFGVNEFALRLPTAMAAIATVLVVYLFTRRVTENRATSLLAALILLGTGGYHQVHVARTADYDSLLVLFITLATFRLFFAIENLGSEPRKDAGFYAAGAFVVGGLLTKGVAALSMLPGCLLYAVVTGKTRALLACRAVWISTAIVLLSATLFLAAREMAGPGFFQIFWRQDVVERFGVPWNPQATGQISYVKGLLWPWQAFWLIPPDDISAAQSAFPWSWLLPFTALFGVLSSRVLTARAAAYLLFCLFCFLVAVTATDAKQPWYVAPAYPVLAALTALGINAFRNFVAERSSRAHLGKTVLPASLALGVACVLANAAKTERSLRPANYTVDRQLHYFLRSFASGHRAYPRIRVVRVIDIPEVVDGKYSPTERYDGPIHFYVLELRRTTADVQIVGAGYVARPGDIIIGCGRALRAAHSNLAVLKQEASCFALGDPRQIQLVPVNAPGA